jgi:murein L,D-transpeptidase YcbB/YkuD
LQVWENGRVIREHRVIVGTNEFVRMDDEKDSGFLNQTMRLKSEITTVIYNPMWRVPPRIKVYELEKSLEENPDFYQENNYTVMTRPDGSEYIVQMPGEKNALGRVKFQFPNPFGIYLHDTPKKFLFDRHFRAFSHGCIRLENALELAHWLLLRQDLKTEMQIDAILKTTAELGIPLKDKVPIYIEYHTVSADESGNLHFFADVYHHDQDYIDTMEKGGMPGRDPGTLANLSER